MRFFNEIMRKTSAFEGNLKIRSLLKRMEAAIIFVFNSLHMFLPGNRFDFIEELTSFEKTWHVKCIYSRSMKEKKFEFSKL